MSLYRELTRGFYSLSGMTHNIESHSSIASGAAASAFFALCEGFALRSLAFLAHSIAIARRSPLSLLTRAARFLTCGADFLCLPVRWSGLLVWRLRFAKPALFLLFLFVAPIVLLSMCGHTSMAVELRLQRERYERCGRARSAGAVQRCAAMQVRALQQPELEAQRFAQLAGVSTCAAGYSEPHN